MLPHQEGNRRNFDMSLLTQGAAGVAVLGHSAAICNMTMNDCSGIAHMSATVSRKRAESSAT